MPRRSRTQARTASCTSTSTDRKSTKRRPGVTPHPNTTPGSPKGARSPATSTKREQQPTTVANRLDRRSWSATPRKGGEQVLACELTINNKNREPGSPYGPGSPNTQQE